MNLFGTRFHVLNSICFNRKILIEETIKLAKLLPFLSLGWRHVPYESTTNDFSDFEAVPIPFKRFEASGPVDWKQNAVHSSSLSLSLSVIYHTRTLRDLSPLRTCVSFLGLKPTRAGQSPFYQSKTVVYIYIYIYISDIIIRIVARCRSRPLTQYVNPIFSLPLHIKRPRDKQYTISLATRSWSIFWSFLYKTRYKHQNKITQKAIGYIYIHIRRTYGTKTVFFYEHPSWQ